MLLWYKSVTYNSVYIWSMSFIQPQAWALGPQLCIQSPPWCAANLYQHMCAGHSIPPTVSSKVVTGYLPQNVFTEGLCMHIQLIRLISACTIDYTCVGPVYDF